MLLLTILALSCLLAIVCRVKRDFLFPPVIFIGTWLLSLLGLLFSGDSFYKISSGTCLLYLIGAISFSVGGVFGLIIRQNRAITQPLQNSVPRSSRLINLVLNLALLLLIIGIPFYWERISDLVGDISLRYFFVNIRAKMVELQDERSSFSFITNLGILSNFVAFACFYEKNESWVSRWRLAAAIMLALLYGGMTGAKTSVVIPIMSLFFISSIKSHNLHVGKGLLVLSISVLLFSCGLLIVNYVAFSFSNMKSLVFAIGRGLQIYWLSGLVAFEKIMNNPNIMESTRAITRFFLETARSLGMNIYVPSKHADFTSVASGTYTNFYTIYFSYYKDFGWIGTVILLMALGTFLTLLYRKALKRSPIAVIFYGMICPALMLSIQAEHFFLDLNFFIKGLIFFTFLYKGIPLLEKYRHAIRLRHA